MRSYAPFLLILQFLLINSASGEQQFQEVRIIDPYIELRTGAGETYPIFYVVERNQTVQILKRKTSWFKVRTSTGKEGWVSREQMEQTLTTLGGNLHINDVTRSDYSNRRWEVGALAGDFNGANSLGLYGAYAMDNSLSAEVTLSQVLDDFSDSLLLSVNLVTQPYPEWRVSPFFSLGTGIIDTNSRQTLVQSEDNSDQINHVGIGFRMHLTSRFLLRVEYLNYVAFTSRNDNKEFNAWRAGLAAFF
jgi:Bacterial SH3 domain/Outer membrane protein beta-barrel domain